MERENDNVDIWHLIVSYLLWGLAGTDHSPDGEIWTDSLFLSIFLHVIQRIHTRRYKVSSFVVIQFLILSVATKERSR
jgi:hypothetical protein